MAVVAFPKSCRYSLLQWRALLSSPRSSVSQFYRLAAVVFAAQCTFTWIGGSIALLSFASLNGRIRFTGETHVEIELLEIFTNAFCLYFFFFFFSSIKYVLNHALCLLSFTYTVRATTKSKKKKHFTLDMKIVQPVKYRGHRPQIWRGRHHPPNLANARISQLDGKYNYFRDFSFLSYVACFFLC